MTRHIARRLVMLGVLLLLAISGASCYSPPSSGPSDVLPTPSAVPDPNPQSGVD
jgi:hypothetical protein